MPYKLIIFDLDGTLAPLDSSELYPDARAWMENNPTAQYVIATNQGGVGLRLWMEAEGFGEPGKYPTMEQWHKRLDALYPFGVLVAPQVYICTRYQSKKSGKWSPVPYPEQSLNQWRADWRKPEPGMLIAAMEEQRVAPEETLMVGDGAEDQLAAENAGCDFQWAWEFFGREKPETVEE